MSEFTDNSRSIVINDFTNKHFMARIISIIFFLLGLIMAPVCYFQGSMNLVYISIGYSVIFLCIFVQLCFSKNLIYFYIISIAVLYALQILYTFTGGQDGFGIIWIIVLPLFTIYMISKTRFFILIVAIPLLFLMICFWTPIHYHIYQYDTTFRIRFPILFFIECAFSTVIKVRLRKFEKEKSEIFNNLVELKQNLNNQVVQQTAELKTVNENLEKQVLEIMTTLAATIDARDKYTSGHSKRVAEYSKELAKLLNKTKEEQDAIYLVGLLHDIGKIGVPDEIINKTDRLTDDEFEKLKEHPVIGYEILKNMKTMPTDIVIGAHWHHERYDGNGYPDKLKGNNIPEFARIVSVADSYDAMTSNRSYRKLLPQNVVREEIEKGRGTQFDPIIADKMLEMIDSDKDYCMHG